MVWACPFARRVSILTRRMTSLPLAILFTVLAFASCAPVPLPRDNPKGFGTAKYVLVIGCDGFGGMYLENATSFLPNISKFYSQGSTTTRARDQMPSVSAPNWGTIITGMGPEETGIPDNSWEPSDDNPPDSIVLEMPPISGKGKIPETMWRAAKQQNSQLIVAVVESWLWINYLVEPDVVNYNFPGFNNDTLCANALPETMWRAGKDQDKGLVVAVVESWDWIHYLVEPDVVEFEFRGRENDSACANAISMHDFIVQHRPNLMFIHFDSIDEAGHAHQWGSPDYYAAAKNVDGFIGHIFDGLTQAGMMQDTLIMLTADHGGYRYSHGSFSQSNMYIPALFMGPGVRKGYNITSYVTDKDFGPTALNALGLKPGKYMQGKIVEEIYG